MNYHLIVTPQVFQAIWAGLGELPAKMSFAAMCELKAQIDAQEAKAAEAPPADAAEPVSP